MRFTRGYGPDSSEEALRRARRAPAEAGLQAALPAGSMHRTLPFADGIFDCVVCTRVLNHGTIERIASQPEKSSAC